MCGTEKGITSCSELSPFLHSCQMKPTEERLQVLVKCTSMYGLRVLIALKEKGIAYQHLEQDLQNKSQLLLESNPIHKTVPVLIHNGRPICESLVILEYIDEAWPSPAHPSFLPEDPFDRAVARFWADYINKMYDAGDRIIRFPRGEQREQAKNDLIEVLETLDGALRDVSSGGGRFFGGHRIGFVDIALAPFVICWFEAYETLGEFKIWEASKCPNLVKWAEAVGEVPSVKEALSIASPQKATEIAYILRKRYQAI